MEYNFKEIEQRWHQYWSENKTYRIKEDTSKPKFYVLDMFPYPSGAGLHVGHPLGYIASDIISRHKRLKGFNVLHPMGYDAYGLPAEQYAIQTGQHPAITTEENIQRYREQLDRIGFSFDWDREIRTCEPEYYHWTQWAFIQMFDSYYDTKLNKAQPLTNLIKHFEQNGSEAIHAEYSEELTFTAHEWKTMSEHKQQETLLNYRIAYLSDTKVNWCPALGTVLANDEVINGLSERGGHPVEQRMMRQWSLRVSSYADRLLTGLDNLEWSESLKETQRNWIGKSVGAEMQFKVRDTDIDFTIFTTRPDTIYGATFMVLAPESDYVKQVTTAAQEAEIDAYVDATKKRTERERQIDKKVSGVFTGSYATNPINGEEIPIWISDYVLAGYGTGAIMAVPAHDSRDYTFAKHFGLEIRPLIEGANISEESFDAKEGTMINSGFLNGLSVSQAIEAAKKHIEKEGIGQLKTNYRLRDAIFSRQRYWGEPFPVYYKGEIPYMLPLNKLPLKLPEVDKYLPTETGEPPLGRATVWAWDEANQVVVEKSKIDNKTIFPLELNTMPGFAGSSAYYLRYMDPKNDQALVDKKINEYWRNVDLYIGGTEHATGHLIYSRFWNMFLFDINHAVEQEPFKKLVNQGMIQGVTSYAYRLYVTKYIDDQSSLSDSKTENHPICISKGIYDEIQEAIALIKEEYSTRNDEDIMSDMGDAIYDAILFIINKYDYINPSNFDKGKYSDFYSDSDSERFIIGTSIMPIRIKIDYVDNNILDIYAIRDWKENKEFRNTRFVLEDGQYICGSAVEKMSKSYHNVVNPDDISNNYGADTLRLYEMFLGPLEYSKPWDTHGIDGVHRFLRRVWALFYQNNELVVKDEAPSKEELKALHKLIKKVDQDIDNFSFNTSVSAFMICVNELTALKCSKKEILTDFIKTLSPFAPFITEELWRALGNSTSVCLTAWPQYKEEYLVEDEVTYAISFNGKSRFNLTFPADTNTKDIEATVLAHKDAQKWIEGKPIKKVIVVPKKIVNIVM